MPSHAVRLSTPRLLRELANAAAAIQRWWLRARRAETQVSHARRVGVDVANDRIEHRDSARSTRVQQPAKCVVQVDDRTGDFLGVFVVHHLQRGDQPALGALRLFGGERSH
jgi:hypothetical protein